MVTKTLGKCLYLVGKRKIRIQWKITKGRPRPTHLSKLSFPQHSLQILISQVKSTGLMKLMKQNSSFFGELRGLNNKSLKKGPFDSFKKKSCQTIEKKKLIISFQAGIKRGDERQTEKWENNNNQENFIKEQYR